MSRIFQMMILDAAYKLSAPSFDRARLRLEDDPCLRMRRTVFLLFCALAGSSLMAQQVVESHEILAKDRPEAWVMKLVTSELEMLSGVSRDIRPGSFEVGFESGWLPSLDAGQRRIGFDGVKEEKVNRTPAYARARIEVGLPWRISLGMGYIPPVRVGGIRPNHLAWSLGRPIVSGAMWRVGGRAHGQVGSLRGDITCDKETVAAGQDPVRNPYGCAEPSNDEMLVRAVGLELGGAVAATNWLEPYVTAGWNYTDTEFRVNARYSGFVDRNRLFASGPTFSWAGGTIFRISDRIRFDASAFYTPLKVRREGVRMSDGLFNVRFSIFYSIR